jgi:hypothetical protein
MQTRSVLIAILCATSLNGCAVYTAASVGSYAVTGKGLGDHAGSLATGGDCNALKHLATGQYICEMPVVYNRSAF